MWSFLGSKGRWGGRFKETVGSRKLLMPCSLRPFKQRCSDSIFFDTEHLEIYLKKEHPHMKMAQYRNCSHEKSYTKGAIKICKIRKLEGKVLSHLFSLYSYKSPRRMRLNDEKHHFQFNTILLATRVNSVSAETLVRRNHSDTVSVYSRNLGKMIDFTQSEKCKFLAKCI